MVRISWFILTLNMDDDMYRIYSNAWIKERHYNERHAFIGKRVPVHDVAKRAIT